MAQKKRHGKCVQEPQTEASSSATSDRGTCQHGGPSLSPGASVRPRSPSASRSPPGQAPKATCPVPDVGLGRPIIWGADADNDDDNDDDDDDDSDSAHQPGLENLRDSGSHQTFSPAMLHGASGGAEALHGGPQPVLLAPYEYAVSRMHPSSSLQHQSRGDDTVDDDDGDEAHMEEDDERPCDARLRVEAAGAASPDRSSDAGLLDQDRPERIRLRSAAANASSEGELDSPVGEPEVPEEGWMW